MSDGNSDYERVNDDYSTKQLIADGNASYTESGSGSDSRCESDCDSDGVYDRDTDIRSSASPTIILCIPRVVC